VCVPAWLELVDRTYFVSTAEERLLNLVPINTFSRGHPEGPEALSARCATVETEVIAEVPLAKELKRDVKLTVGDGSPKLFAYDQREIEILAKTRRTRQTQLLLKWKG